MNVSVVCHYLAILAIGACAAANQDAVSQSRLMRGDTIVIRTAGNGAWGPPKPPVEVRRIVGPAENQTFGQVDHVVGLPGGGVVVFDAKSRQGLALHQFDSIGQFVRTIGRHGRGPGEYATSFVSLTANAQGELFLLDKLLSRVTRFDSAGRYLGDFRIPPPAGRTPDFIADANGGIFVASDLPKQSLLQFDSTGRIIDSIPRPQMQIASGRRDVFATFTATANGEVIIGRADAVGFLLIAKGRSPLVAELPAQPPAYLPGEREELQAIQKQVEQTSRNRTAHFVLPESKLLSVATHADLSGRIWVRRTATAQRIPSKVKYWGTGMGEIRTTWEEPPRYAVFQSDGSYLGEMEFPVGARISAVRNAVWAIVPGENDEPILVNYAIPY